MKPWAYAVIILALIAARGGVYAAGHSSGYEKRDNEVKEELLAAVEAARADEEEKWHATVAAARAAVRVETVIEEKIRVVEKEVPKIVQEIITVKPECSNLGDSYARVRNNQIRAANNIQTPEAGLSPD